MSAPIQLRPESLPLPRRWQPDAATNARGGDCSISRWLRLSAIRLFIGRACDDSSPGHCAVRSGHEFCLMER